MEKPEHSDECFMLRMTVVRGRFIPDIGFTLDHNPQQYEVAVLISVDVASDQKRWEQQGMASGIACYRALEKAKLLG